MTTQDERREHLKTLCQVRNRLLKEAEQSGAPFISTSAGRELRAVIYAIRCVKATIARNET